MRVKDFAFNHQSTPFFVIRLSTPSYAVPLFQNIKFFRFQITDKWLFFLNGMAIEGFESKEIIQDWFYLDSDLLVIRKICVLHFSPFGARPRQRSWRARSAEPGEGKTAATSTWSTRGTNREWAATLLSSPSSSSPRGSGCSSATLSTREMPCKRSICPHTAPLP